MEYPKRFANLPVATWPRLRGLLDAVQPGGDPINMTIGDPQHPMPPFLADAMAAQIAGFGGYPNNDGAPALLDAISRWLNRRYGVTVATNEIMALNGTREGLYNASMALCPEVKNGQTPVILTPNPFYQVYAVAALSVGAEPVYLPATADTGHLPDFDAVPADVLDRTAIAYICSPANPQGAVATEDYWRNLITLAEKHDFKIFADECYSEIYRGIPPVGALQVAQAMGADPERVVIFHSLSKRSNLAGLRSGFCASGPKNIAAIRALRAYAGAPLPGPIQAVSALVWDDEDHVIASRALYAEKFDIADRIFGNVPGYTSPEAGFFLWLPVPDGEKAALTLWSQTGVRTLPGAYLSRDVSGFNPGAGFIRVALCGPKSDVERGLTRLRDTLYQ
ncbi:MAG: N-succinyldiaminopimelate aminotransferase [Loktanella salsilacus]|jgi:N-succinyldiaminopimelate aminotransferase|uniref:Aspartate/methionine/tyrosine aminotransferase n=1 Tax=Loktanella salsilacus TaxID=195913 RepID=A0A1I4F1H0_9RHOB|nr:aminotransferase class I/II-fold pyridoxal phosphate-dependent enzyme [Loktanella salsilacus]MBU0780866.1 aminotransferase class I/II-fold pyridoxal phosphate-dependent enzyme [Alphaproteobacteria bacterium]MBU1834727.1 aminotransferase class I/II-fold pyridoxal phosphate-dependent enzyme [Alphaproteobacteria bacterium]SFL11764.1 Aspartate/methionine/tyrosine aminotransferase [Loktanella salsilacus]